MDLEHNAIEILKMASERSIAYYEKPLLVAYSGGKDSDVVLELCKRAGIPFEVIHSHTTADAPETVYYVRKVFHELELGGVRCEVKYPEYKGQRTSMWELIPQKLMPPTRIVRYCCSVCKENTGKNRMLALGIRREESQNRKDAGPIESQGRTRKGRIIYDFDNDDPRMIVHCLAKQKIKAQPIVEWKERDVWTFLRDAQISVNPCYSMGFKRVGCVGCPMAGKGRWREFEQWPKLKNLYYGAFARMLAERKRRGKPCQWKTADEVWRWWMDDKNLDGQLDLFGYEIGGMTDGRT